MTIKKPMLSATVHSDGLEGLRWPVLASPKLDGIRVLNHPELGIVTRSFKPLPNLYVRDMLRDILGFRGMDGELLALDAGNTILDFNTTQSAVMSRGGQPNVRFAIFDCFDKPGDEFQARLLRARNFTQMASHRCVSYVEHQEVATPEDFLRYQEACIQMGYEGVMLRAPEGPYKEGRSTLKQQWLVKYKEWADAEGTVVGFEERMHNANEDIKDNFGHAKRSSHKENMVPMGTLGALILDTVWGELRVGTGFDDALRQEIWTNNNEPDVYGAQLDLGRTVTFKYQAFGMQDKPRFPVFLRFREEE